MTKFRTYKQNFEKMKGKNLNLLHPSFLEFISSQKVVDLILKYDTQKVERRTSGKKRDWGGQRNLLHKNKKFFGNFQRQKVGSVVKTVEQSSSFQQFIAHYHKVPTPCFSLQYFGGLGAGERCFSVSYRSQKKSLALDLTMRQNHRQFHLLAAVKNLFGVGSINAMSVWNNKSTYIWGCQNLTQNYSLVAPKIHQIQFLNVKDEEKKLWYERRMAWGTKTIDNTTIGLKFGSSLNKPTLRKPVVVPTLPGDFVRGFLDGEGSMAQKGNYGTLFVSQKDPVLIFALHNYFHQVGTVYNSGNSWYLVINLSKNLSLMNDFFNQHKVHRTDLIVKMHLVTFVQRLDLTYLRKLPEYLPAGALQLHILKKNGVVLPDELLEILETHYPLELGLYYQDIYENLFHKYNLDSSLLPWGKDSKILSF